MIRTQVQLTEQQVQTLKCLATARGLSMAELIRQSIDTLLNTQDVDLPESRQRAIAAAAKIRADVSDLETNHDRYLAEAFER